MNTTTLSPAPELRQSRFNMIEQQIRPWDVLDPRVLEVLDRLPREMFVPDASRTLAYTDVALPIGHGEVMMEPKVEARLIQELAIRPGDTAYEVGTGSGYFTALLASFAKEVTTVDLRGDFIETARRRLKAAHFGNIHFKEGDSAREPLGHEAYDVIALTGSTPLLSPRFLERLRPHGRLVVVEGEFPVMKAVLYRKDGEGGITRTELFETMLPPLLNAPAKSHFSF